MSDVGLNRPTGMRSRILIQGGDTGGLESRSLRDRVMPKMFAALRRKIGVRINAKSPACSSRCPPRVVVTAVH